MITSIRLQNFRSYSDESFEFEPGVNIIVGPNASGKTNLLEAVMVLARGGSYRARDAELIKFDEPWARLDGLFEKQARTLKIIYHPQAPKTPLQGLPLKGSIVTEVKLQGVPLNNLNNKVFEIDGKEFKRLGLEHTVPAVFFEPNHLQLMTRGPEARRDYFDDLLERSQPGFKTLMAGYRRTLAQRNALLKHHRSQAAQQLFAWNIRLSELGSQIAQARQNLIDDINKTIGKNYSRIAGNRAKVELKYGSQFPAAGYASRMLSRLEKDTDKDFTRGFTGSGPHREDILFYLGARPAGATASRGESRSLLLALKIFELGLIKKARRQTPVFLLDDVFSELDGARRRALVASLAGHQTIITTTDAETVLEYFSENTRLISL